MTKDKKQGTNTELEERVAELTADLQRTRADFENYRKRVEAEKAAAREAGKAGAIMKLLPIIDAIVYSPLEDLRNRPIVTCPKSWHPCH